MIDTLANREIQVRVNGEWKRYATTWAEYVDVYLREATERGYEEARAIPITY